VAATRGEVGASVEVKLSERFQEGRSVEGTKILAAFRPKGIPTPGGWSHFAGA
jgi:hypothetical protein